MPGIRYRRKRQLEDDARLMHLAGHGSGAGNLVALEDLEDDVLSGTNIADRSIIPSKLTSYIFRDVQITGTPTAPQTILFANLGAPDEGGTMPAFIAPPRVSVTAQKSEMPVVLVYGSVTATQFQVYALAVGADETAYCDIEITDLGLAV